MMDGFNTLSLLRRRLFNDYPAPNKGGGTAFSYCDGHAALHQWRDTFLDVKNKYKAGDQDPAWLAAHGTYH